MKSLTALTCNYPTLASPWRLSARCRRSMLVTEEAAARTCKQLLKLLGALGELLDEVFEQLSITFLACDHDRVPQCVEHCAR